MICSPGYAGVERGSKIEDRGSKLVALPSSILSRSLFKNLQPHLRAVAGEHFGLRVDVGFGRVDRDRRLSEADRDQIELDRRARDVAGGEDPRQVGLVVRAD